MSGIETIKIIVEAEKEAAKILEDAHSKATAAPKQLDLQIVQQREKILQDARRRAVDIVQRAEEEGKAEADDYEKSTEATVRDLVTRASNKKNAAVEMLVGMVLEGKG
jgi:vacuolar-type H+-ATPase subunit H